MKKLIFPAAMAIFFAITSCKKETKVGEPTTTETETVTTTDSTASTTESATTATTTTAVAKKTVGDWDAVLNSAKVVGNVLSVDISVQPNKENPSHLSQYPKLEEISMIEDQTSKKVGLLKDDKGAAMASPINDDASHDKLGIFSSKDPVIVSLKFPAPAADVKMVSINLPGFGSFDGVPVAR